MSGTINDPIPYTKGDSREGFIPGKTYVLFVKNGSIALFCENGTFKLVKGGGRGASSVEKKKANMQNPHELDPFVRETFQETPQENPQETPQETPQGQEQFQDCIIL